MSVVGLHLAPFVLPVLAVLLILAGTWIDRHPDQAHNKISSSAFSDGFARLVVKTAPYALIGGGGILALALIVVFAR